MSIRYQSEYVQRDLIPMPIHILVLILLFVEFYNLITDLHRKMIRILLLFKFGVRNTEVMVEPIGFFERFIWKVSKVIWSCLFDMFESGYFCKFREEIFAIEIDSIRALNKLKRWTIRYIRLVRPKKKYCHLL